MVDSMEKIQLSVLIPVKDEAESIPLLVQEIQVVLNAQQKINSWEIILVDDGSRDATPSEIKSLISQFRQVKGFRFHYNRGKAEALDFGFQIAQGEFIITMDGDLQDNPKEILALYEKINQGYDLVSGWKKKRYDPWHKRFPSKLFNLTTSLVAGLRLHDYNCGLKIYRSELAKQLRIYGDFHRYIPVMANWRGYRVTEMVVEHRARQHGVSKYGAFRLISGFLDLITLVFLHKFAVKPLHLFGTLGLFFFLFGSGIMGYFGVQWLIERALHVRPLLLIGVTSLLMGIQFISLGLLGEMVNARFDNTRIPQPDELKGT
jgi:glycosyltransferase involved in cell wall biosynthesis